MVSLTSINFSNVVVCFLSTFVIYCLLLLVLCVLFSKAKRKSLLTPWKLGSIKWFKFGLWSNTSGFDTYLVQLIVLLKPDFNYGNNFASSWVDKVTTGTKRLVSVIVNVVFWFAILVLIIAQFADHVKISLTSQLISRIIFQEFSKVVHRHYYIIVFCIFYLCIIYFAYAISKWSAIFKY